MARRDKTKKKKGNVVTVDFSEVQSNSTLPEISAARLKVVGAESMDNDGDGSIKVRIEVVDCDLPKAIGKTTTIFFNLGKTSLWVLRNFLDALGVDVPESEHDIDLDGLIDLEFIADVVQHEYNDKISNRLANFQISDEAPAKDEDEDVVKIKGKKSKSEDEDEEEEEAPRKKSKKSRDEDEEEEDERPSKKSKKKSRDEDEEDEDEAPKKKRKSRDEDEEDEDEKPRKKSKKSKDEDEDEEEDDTPKKKKSKGVVTEDEVREMDEKELKGLVKKYELDVDLSDYPSTRKKAMAVVDALEENDLLIAE